MRLDQRPLHRTQLNALTFLFVYTSRYLFFHSLVSIYFVNSLNFLTVKRKTENIYKMYSEVSYRVCRIN